MAEDGLVGGNAAWKHDLEDYVWSSQLRGILGYFVSAMSNFLVLCLFAMMYYLTVD